MVNNQDRNASWEISQSALQGMIADRGTSFLFWPRGWGAQSEVDTALEREKMQHTHAKKGKWDRGSWLNAKKVLC